jgi:hypothetical protein
MNDGFSEAEADRLVEGTKRNEQIVRDEEATLYPFAAEVGKANTLAGQKFVGAIDGMDCIELVFEGPEGANMLTVDFRRGTIHLGHVDLDLMPDYGTQHHALRPETA